ncbi:FAD/FMN-containing dehydrogenase [Nitrosospira sp. Nl5]|nr:D-arabinono-1,4-lactone oxidase [Nitrosospira sp. Nl5]SCY70282.1 FAD/FMN-containing dehydrogenase [Nitrosospira sp. Nl5]
MGLAWENWSGSLRFRPYHLSLPASESEVLWLVQKALRHRRRLRPVGASHTSMPLYSTDDTLVSLEKMSGVIHHDEKASTARCLPGTTMLTLGKELLDRKLSPINLGDVALQQIAGAIGTGTHGTGMKIGNLSTMLVGGRLVTGKGEVLSFSENDSELLKAMRVSLGMLGIFTELKLKLLPLYRLRRREWFTTFFSLTNHLDDLCLHNRNFDFYWYPRSDEVKIRTLNFPDEGKMNVPGAKLDEDWEDWAQNILHKHTKLKNRFDEMEYDVPFAEGPSCFLKIRERILSRWRRSVCWRLLYRTIEADDSYLSPATGRRSVSISLHQNAGLPYEEYFRDIEPILLSHGGRPHWAKKHTLKKEDLKKLYPAWDKFFDLRRKLDPEGLFLNPYLEELR